MKKNLFLAATMAATCLCGYAYTEVNETMTVSLKNGKTVVINIEDMERVDFGVTETTIGLQIADADGNLTCRNESAGTMYRYIADSESQNIKFVFGSASDAQTVGELAKGDYVVTLDCPLSTLYQGEVALGEAGAPAVTLYQFADGEVVNTIEGATTGTLSTVRNTKGVLTLELDCVMADDTALRASYVGTPEDVDSLDELFPPKPREISLKYYNSDGNLTQDYGITAVKATAGTSSFSGMTCFTITPDDPYGMSGDCKIYIVPELIGQTLVFGELEDWSVYFTYGSVQVGGPNDQFRPEGVKGTIAIVDNGDGTVTIDADVTNQYKNLFGGTGVSGTPERVEVYYTGPCTGFGE